MNIIQTASKTFTGRSQSEDFAIPDDARHIELIFSRRTNARQAHGADQSVIGSIALQISLDGGQTFMAGGEAGIAGGVYNTRRGIELTHSRLRSLNIPAGLGRIGRAVVNVSGPWHASLEVEFPAVIQ